MNTDAHNRRLKTLALARARLHGSRGADFMDHLGNLDHIEFEKHEAGDYRAVIDGLEVVVYKMHRTYSTQVGWFFGFRKVSRDMFPNVFVDLNKWADLMPMPSLKTAKAWILDQIANDPNSDILWSADWRKAKTIRELV